MRLLGARFTAPRVVWPGREPMSRLSPCAPVTPRRLGAKFRPSNSAERRLAPLRHFGIADNRFATRDVVCQVVQFFRDAAQYLLDVRLDSDICQSSRMVGLRMIIVRTTRIPMKRRDPKNVTPRWLDYRGRLCRSGVAQAPTAELRQPAGIERVDPSGLGRRSGAQPNGSHKTSAPVALQ
jgi:hypothetical protein